MHIDVRIVLFVLYITVRNAYYVRKWKMLMKHSFYITFCEK